MNQKKKISILITETEAVDVCNVMYTAPVWTADAVTSSTELPAMFYLSSEILPPYPKKKDLTGLVKINCCKFE